MKHLRQEDLETLDLAWKTVQKIEYAATDPKASTMLKLSSAFEMNLIELLAPVISGEALPQREKRQRVRLQGKRRRR